MSMRDNDTRWINGNEEWDRNTEKFKIFQCVASRKRTQKVGRTKKRRKEKELKLGSSLQKTHSALAAFFFFRHTVYTTALNL